MGHSGAVLEADGEVVQSFAGSDSPGPVGVIWDVSRLHGRQVTLAIFDEDSRPGGWIGIDDIVSFNGLAE